MSKKSEVKMLSPSQAIRSLESYNEKVLMLVAQCNIALQHNLVDKAVSESMSYALKDVQAFYDTE